MDVGSIRCWMIGIRFGIWICSFLLNNGLDLQFLDDDSNMKLLADSWNLQFFMTIILIWVASIDNYKIKFLCFYICVMDEYQDRMWSGTFSLATLFPI